jgi:hypothetical protein
MRSISVIFFTAVILLSGCAFEGVIVEKRFRPLPFPDSLGVDGMYNFQLRDHAGQIHSQMVTADVFANYRVGDYFNDLQSPPSYEDKDWKGIRPGPVEMNEGPYQPVRVMQIQQSAQNASKVAARPHHHAKHTKIAKAHHRTKHVSKIAKNHPHTKKRARIAGNHRARHQRTVASAK